MLDRSLTLSFLSLIAVALPGAAPVAAQDATPPTVSMRIEQQSTGEAIGAWTLIKPGDLHTEGTRDSVDIEEPAVGNYTLVTRAPKGYNSQIIIFNGSAIQKSVDIGEVTFPVVEGDQLRIVVHYFLVRIGRISVSSDPPGLGYVITGPNRFEKSGTTPASFLDVPEGQYMVQYTTLDGCPPISAQGRLLQKDTQISFSVTLQCDEADRIRQENKDKQKSDTNIVVNIDGQPVTLMDVPKGVWFGSYVESAASLGILAGYKDDNGQPTGIFGPSDSITLGQLATIAHRLSGLNADDVSAQPINAHARGQWYERSVASAEQRGWPVFMDETQSLERPATRGEVLVTLLQALNVPLTWQTGTVFKDVTPRTAYASAIETASAEGLVSGRTNEQGNDTGMFGPTDSINRAEMAKLIVAAVQKYRNTLATR